jgi:hypothetical protein
MESEFPTVDVDDLGEESVRQRVRKSRAPVIRIPKNAGWTRREMARRWAVELGAIIEESDR